MSKTIIHTADSRGKANHGWLQSHHSFSFANYYDPERMHFGALRVLNDDVVASGLGFGLHPHKNMEIISIPLEGDLEHKDSMGNVAIIKKGDIQIMSAGSGITHSEYNKSRDNKVKFLQIWIIPNQQNVTPRYQQITLNSDDRHNTLQQIMSPNEGDEGVWLHQQAWMHLGTMDAGVQSNYAIKQAGNGVYAFVIHGSVDINGHKLQTRDAMGIWEVDELQLTASASDTEILLIEVPMSF